MEKEKRSYLDEFIIREAQRQAQRILELKEDLKWLEESHSRLYTEDYDAHRDIIYKDIEYTKGFIEGLHWALSHLGYSTIRQ